MGMGFSRDDSGQIHKSLFGEKNLRFDHSRLSTKTASDDLSKWALKAEEKPNRDLRPAFAGNTAEIRKVVKFCHRVGMDYVSCSPYRVPMRVLAAAQAVVEEKRASYTRRNKKLKQKPRNFPLKVAGDV